MDPFPFCPCDAHHVVSILQGFFANLMSTVCRKRPTCATQLDTHTLGLHVFACRYDSSALFRAKFGNHRDFGLYPDDVAMYGRQYWWCVIASYVIHLRREARQQSCGFAFCQILVSGYAELWT